MQSNQQLWDKLLLPRCVDPSHVDQELQQCSSLLCLLDVDVLTTNQFFLKIYSGWGATGSQKIVSFRFPLSEQGSRSWNISRSPGLVNQHWDQQPFSLIWLFTMSRLEFSPRWFFMLLLKLGTKWKSSSDQRFLLLNTRQQESIVQCKYFNHLFYLYCLRKQNCINFRNEIFITRPRGSCCEPELC